MMDELNERDPDLATLQDMRKQFQQLLDHPAWGKLIAIVQGQVDELQQVCLRPLAHESEVYLKEFQKGQLEGRLSFTSTLETLIGELELDIERKQNG
jgi:hypothetical protein